MKLEFNGVRPPRSALESDPFSGALPRPLPTSQPHQPARVAEVAVEAREVAQISPRPILITHGEKAHSRYFSETAYAAADEPKELLIIPGVNHVDLYDRLDKIPFDRIAAFFGKNLK